MALHVAAPLSAALLFLMSGVASSAPALYVVAPDHPRIFITKPGLRDLAERCAGPLAEDYRLVKESADLAVSRDTIPALANRWATPVEMLNCGLAYLVEREAGRPCRPY